MQPDAVLKIGGSLGREDGLRTLCRDIQGLGERYSLIIVPGGGQFADLVRESYRKYNLNESAAHCMALLAMDQFGYLLNHLIGNSSLETEPGSVAKTTRNGRVPILLPSASVLRNSRLPHSWQVTSDTIAAWVARVVGCRKLILLKNVDGLMHADASGKFHPQCIREMTTEQLKMHTGGVDEYLPRILDSAGLESWVISGVIPGRLVELLDAGNTVGTRILPASCGRRGLNSSSFRS